MTAMEALLRRLRSGHVKQTKHKLGTPNGDRCCLGLACDVSREYGVIPEPTLKVLRANAPNAETVLEYGNENEEKSSAFLPPSVREFFGFTSAAGTYKDSQGTQRSLQQDNDNLALTFSVIADIIESRPKGLFVEPPTV